MGLWLLLQDGLQPPHAARKPSASAADNLTLNACRSLRFNSNRLQGACRDGSARSRGTGILHWLCVPKAKL